MYVIWMQQQNMANKREWDGLWTEQHELKHDLWSVDWRKWDKIQTMKCGNEMKHEQWSRECNIPLFLWV